MDYLKDYKTNIKEIVLSDEEEKSFCDIFVYEPENIEEKSLGNLYIVGEIVNLPENSSYIVNLLASIIKKEFYSNKKRSTVESLEASLNKANSTLSEITEQGNVDWIGNLNMTCAAHCQKELHLSQTGKIKTYLIRNGRITDIGKSIDLEEKPHPFRTFSNIASGELEINDLVLFATPGLFNILSTEKIRQMSVSDEFEDFGNKMQEFAEKDNASSTIAALLVAIESKKEESKIPQRAFSEEIAPSENILKQGKAQPVYEESSTKSLESESEKNAERISLENIIKEFETRENASGRKTANEKENVGFLDLSGARLEADAMPEVETKLVEKILPEPHVASEESKTEHKPENKIAMPNFSKAIGAVLQKVSKTLQTSSAHVKNLFSAAISKIKKPEIDVTQKLKLARNSKIIFSTMALIFIVLLGNVVINNYNNQIEAEKQRYADLLKQSQSKIDEAEQVLIYNDSEKARKSLTEAKELAIEVRDGYKNLYNDANLLLDKIQIQIDKIDKVIRLDSPAVAMDFSKNEKLSDTSTLTKFKGSYYTLAADQSVYKLDLGSGAASEIKPSKKNIDGTGKIKLATTLSKTGEIIFLAENNKIVTFNPEKLELKSQNVELNSDLTEIKAIASYNSFIYLLQPGSNQIYKHKETVDGFGTGTKWMNEKTGIDIRNATSMTIDSTIYILRTDGSVEKYLTGNKVKFSVEELKDPASNPNIIFTETALKNLYIADPSKNRIIVFDKAKGTFVKQYIVKNFNSNIKDMTVDDEEKTLFVLSEKNIFKLDLAAEVK